MKRVTGIGGVFFKAKDPAALRKWYAEHLGVPIQEWGGAVFNWREPAAPSQAGKTIWSVFDHDTTQFDPVISPQALRS